MHLRRIPDLDCNRPLLCSLYNSWPRLFHICHPEHLCHPKSPWTKQEDIICSRQFDQQPLYPSSCLCSNWCDHFDFNERLCYSRWHSPRSFTLDQLGGCSWQYLSSVPGPSWSLASLPHNCYCTWNGPVDMCCLCLCVFRLFWLFWWGYKALLLCYQISWEVCRSFHWKIRQFVCIFGVCYLTNLLDQAYQSTVI